jgi:hypothetical protein
MLCVLCHICVIFFVLFFSHFFLLTKIVYISGGAAISFRPIPFAKVVSHTREMLAHIYKHIHRINTTYTETQIGTYDAYKPGHKYATDENLLRLKCLCVCVCMFGHGCVLV